jgi:exopolysaccharide biosynthesis protein
MNLDGGGSTTMYLDGNVVNHPSDKEGERKVSDALVVTARTAAVPARKSRP